jgi:tetratricopeptide (TPR) repeat protein
MLMTNGFEVEVCAKSPRIRSSLMNRDLSTHTTLALCALLIALTLALYWPVRTYDFVNFDDPDYVSANPMVQAGLTRDSIRWAFTQAHSSNWHPVTWMSHMLDCQFFGLNAGAHHLVNAGFHAVNAALVFVLLVHLTGARWRSAVVAALFAWHPLHVESVAWISERKDVLSAFFGLLCLLAYVRYVNESKGQSVKAKAAYALALVFFALGLMSKPMLVTWPFVMLLLDYWPLRRFERSTLNPQPLTLPRLLLEKLPFFALAVASSVVTVIAQRGSGATVPLDALPLSARLAQMPASYVRYLGKTFWPENLAAFYPYTPAEWDAPLTLAGVMVLVTVSTWAVVQLRRRPFLAVGWFWFLGTLVPVIGLVQVGRQSIADRYTYLPHIGLFLAVVWFAAEGFERIRLPRRVRGACVGAVLVLCVALTAGQIPQWRDTATLARHATRVTQGNYVAHAQLAAALTLEGRYDEALTECVKALKFRPTYAEAHNTMAMIHTRQGQFEKAMAAYHEAIRCDATYPDAHHGLAELHFRQGQWAEAEQAAREAVRLWPMHLGALYTLASALHNQGKLEEAVATYRQLAALKPGLFSVHRGLGAALVAKGELESAIPEYRQALVLEPQNADAHNSLGLVLLARGEVSAASNHFSLALAAQPTNAIANYQVALMLTAAQQPAQALPHYRATLRAQPDLPDVLNNLAWLLAANANPAVRDAAEAVRLAERACTLTQYREPFFIGTLAAAYAAAGRFDDAVSTAGKAIAVAETAGLTEIAERNQQLRELYRAGTPFYESP